MPWWLAGLGLLAAIGFGWLVTVWLLGEADRGTTRAELRIDAIRTGLTVVAGTGAGVALLIAARRQWLGERAQRHREQVATQNRQHQDRVQAHQEQVAATNQRHEEHDATERRITDLYTKAVELLGSDRPAVRLGGLYALERLAQGQPAHRQTIVDVICAYLRMPEAEPEGADLEVRQTAQRILTRHLRPGAGDGYWPDLAIDLRDATLLDLDASGCRFGSLDLRDTTFEANTRFAEAVFVEPPRLRGASFTGTEVSFVGAELRAETTFEAVTFGCPVDFAGARFEESVRFDAQTSFEGPAMFRGVVFHRSALFEGVRFGANASFGRTTFQQGASFEHATFEGEVGFRRTRFSDMAMLRFVTFGVDVSFEDAVFEGHVDFARATFHGAALFTQATWARKGVFTNARANRSAHHAWPDGFREVPIDDDWVAIERR